ncbi:hypothetical protein QMQ05_05635 [Glutamicibacter ectropisis]|uniref:DUF222 domain-containing protein n=1 Tax=Glutamicibacter ectropisis TaxID=3046593 RepID=A0AAU6WGU5_9MICC
MSRNREEHDQAYGALRAAGVDFYDARQLVGSAAVDIAEQVVTSGTVDQTAIDVYRKAKELAEQKEAAAAEAREYYARAYRIMIEQEKEVPPAGASAEGESKLEIAECRVANDERMLVTRFALDSERDAGSQQKAKRPVSSVDIHPEGLATIDLLNNGGQRIRVDGRVSIGDDLPAVNDCRHDSSLSVDGAPCGAVGGTSESTERGLTPVVPEMKEHPAAATAGCDETKNQR